MNVPEFFSGEVKSDGTNLEVAERCAINIKDAWRKCGYDINVRILSQGTKVGTVYTVVTDLVNGLPPDDKAKRLQRRPRMRAIG